MDSCKRASRADKADPAFEKSALELDCDENASASRDSDGGGDGGDSTKALSGIILNVMDKPACSSPRRRFPAHQ